MNILLWTQIIYIKNLNVEKCKPVKISQLFWEPIQFASKIWYNLLHDFKMYRLNSSLSVTVQI